jgi:hypothetical protein
VGEGGDGYTRGWRDEGGREGGEEVN